VLRTLACMHVFFSLASLSSIDYSGRYGRGESVQTLWISLNRRICLQCFTLILCNSNDNMNNHRISAPWSHKENNSDTANLLLVLINLQFYPLILSAGHRRHALPWFVVVVFIVFSWYYRRCPVGLIKVIISSNRLRCKSRHASAGIKLLS